MKEVLKLGHLYVFNFSLFNNIYCESARHYVHNNHCLVNRQKGIAETQKFFIKKTRYLRYFYISLLNGVC